MIQHELKVHEARGVVLKYSVVLAVLCSLTLVIAVPWHPATRGRMLAGESSTYRDHWESVIPDVSARTEGVLPDVAKSVLELEKQGKGRKLIVTCLYGSDPRYTLNAIHNAMLAQRDWPGWTLRVYYGASVPEQVLDILKGFGAELVSAQHFKSDVGSVWRFFALGDRTATRVIMRDADAKLSMRDRLAVEDWVKSGRYFHVLHDHQWHKPTIMAGMWGAVNGFINPKLLDGFLRANSTQPGAPAGQAGVQETARWGLDQDWLHSVVWPLVRNETLNTASFHCKAFEGVEFHPFPTQRSSPLDFVGQVYTAQSMYRGDYAVEQCPPECRRDGASDC